MNLNRRPGKAQNIAKVYPRLRKVMVYLSVLVVIGLAIVVGIVVGTKIFSPSKSSTVRERTLREQKFVLPYSDELKKEGKSQQEIITVEDGPGTFHRLWANKPYVAISLEIDGRKSYNMPAGWNSWTGHWPPGRLWLMAKEKDTVVKTWKVR